MRNFDKKYMQMAKIWATNSYAKRHKVGALIVKDGMIISDGFNGTPSGFENECEDIVSCGNTCTNLFGQDCINCKEHKLGGSCTYTVDVNKLIAEICFQMPTCDILKGVNDSHGAMAALIGSWKNL